jgi:hypothetical protein
VRTARRLEKLLDGTGVRLLHDRRIPGHGRANIDHLAVGNGGVTVIDSKAIRGQVRVRRVGGLFSPRRSILLIAGRDRTRLVDGVERQVDAVREALDELAVGEVDVRGALCFPDPDGLPVFGQLKVRDVVVDCAKPVARLAGRRGCLSPAMFDRLERCLAASFPAA